MELVELKHAHWIKDYNPDRDGWERVRFYCSYCNDWNTYGECKFCPECGAKMDENAELKWTNRIIKGDDNK